MSAVTKIWTVGNRSNLSAGPWFMWGRRRNQKIFHTGGDTEHCCMRREGKNSFQSGISHLLRYEGMRKHGLLRKEWQVLHDWILSFGGIQAGMGERKEIKLESAKGEEFAMSNWQGNSGSPGSYFLTAKQSNLVFSVVFFLGGSVGTQNSRFIGN